MKAVRVGIVGLGVGSWHLSSFAQTPGAEVVALCDLDAKLRSKRGREHGITRLHEDYRELLADPEVDAVSVCVPNSLHRPVALAALRAGKHVLCEKPLANTVAEARRIVREARKHRRVFMVAMKLRYLKEAAWIRALLEKGRLGAVYHGCSHYLRPPGGIPVRPTFVHRRLSGGGALIDNGVHLLDLNWYLMGMPRPVEAFGVTSDRLVRAGRGFGMSPARACRLGCDVEEFGTGVIRFENGASVYLDNAWAAMVPPEGVMGLRVLGEKGGATMWPFSITLARGNRAVDATPDLSGKHSRSPSQFRCFVDCVRKRRKPASTAEQGLTVLKMLDGIYRSNRTGRSVRLTSPG